MFDLVDSSIRKGSNSLVFGKFFCRNVLDRFFRIELEEYRPFELASIIPKVNKTRIAKKVRQNL